MQKGNMSNNMSESEYLKKREQYMSSMATPKEKEVAIKSLDDLYHSLKEAMIEHSQLTPGELNNGS